MRYIGLYIGHDASVAVLDETGELVFFGQVERYSRHKKHGFDLEPLDCFHDMPMPEKGDLIVTCAGPDNYFDARWRASDNISQEDSGYDMSLVRHYKPQGSKNIFEKYVARDPDIEIHHHLAHAFAAWCFRKDDRDKLFLCYDGCGKDALQRLTSYLVGRIGMGGFSKIEDATPIPSSIPIVGLLGKDSAGKAMGMAGYMPKRDWSADRTMELIQYSLNERFEASYPYVGASGQEGVTEDMMQFVADYYRFYTGEIWKAVKDNIERFHNGNGVVIGGGTTLALEINSKIHAMTGDVTFAPPTDDSGLALGCAAFALWHSCRRWPRIATPSLNELQDPLPAVGPQTTLEIARLIADDHVVGLLRGKGEAGPRALGFRSLLALPKAENLKRVSQDIKGREFYRPLAPMVTAEHFDQCFVGPKGEYMQYLVECTEKAQKLLPAVVHRDNTARPQVVYKDKDPWLHELLTHVGEMTGSECVINTSLNRRRKPICNTYLDAERDMQGKGVTLVSLPHDRWSMKERKQINLV